MLKLPQNSSRRLEDLQITWSAGWQMGMAYIVLNDVGDDMMRGALAVAQRNVEQKLPGTKSTRAGKSRMSR